MFQKPPELKLTTPCWKIIISVNSLIKKKAKKNLANKKIIESEKKNVQKKNFFVCLLSQNKKYCPAWMHVHDSCACFLISYSLLFGQLLNY